MENDGINITTATKYQEVYFMTKVKRPITFIY